MNKTKIFLLIGLVIFSSALISASFLESLGKENVCTMLNISEETCNSLWCEEVVGCNYSIEKESCICQEYVFINVTTETEINNSQFYNKTEVDKILAEFNISFNAVNLTETNGTIGNQTFKEYVDERFKTLLSSTDEKIDELKWDFFENDKSGIDPVFIILGVVVLVIIGFAFFKKKNENPEEQLPFSKGNARPIHKKIQSSREMERHEEIEDLKKQIEEFKKNPSGEVEETPKKLTAEEELEKVKKEIEDLKRSLK